MLIEMMAMIVRNWMTFSPFGEPAQLTWRPGVIVLARGAAFLGVQSGYRAVRSNDNIVNERTVRHVFIWFAFLGTLRLFPGR
jgi:hypothetical protein